MAAIYVRMPAPLYTRIAVEERKAEQSRAISSGMYIGKEAPQRGCSLSLTKMYKVKNVLVTRAKLSPY